MADEECRGSDSRFGGLRLCAWADGSVSTERYIGGGGVEGIGSEAGSGIGHNCRSGGGGLASAGWNHRPYWALFGGAADDSAVLGVFEVTAGDRDAGGKAGGVMDNGAMHRLRMKYGDTVSLDVGQLTRLLRIAEAEADKYRRLNESATSALFACASALGVASLCIVFLVVRLGGS
jgi:hypothetical protein